MSIVYGGPQGPLHDFQVSNALCAATRETNQYVAVHFLDGRQLKPQERPSTMIVVVAAAAWIMDGEIVVSPRHGREGVVGADMAGETCPRTEKTQHSLSDVQHRFFLPKENHERGGDPSSWWS
jgi:hypothetical protein